MPRRSATSSALLPRSRSRPAGLGGKSDSCAKSFQTFLDQADKSGGLNLTLKAKVKSVKVTGDEAVASVTFGKGRDGKIPLSKTDGQWKLDAAGATSQQ